MLSAAYWIYAVLISALAVCWAFVLVYDDNALLCPLIRWCRVSYRTRYGRELDDQRWWKPLWGCPMCVAGQWGFWGYLLLFWPTYSPFAHLGFAALTIFFAAGWRAFYALCQSIN